MLSSDGNTRLRVGGRDGCDGANQGSDKRDTELHCNKGRGLYIVNEIVAAGLRVLRYGYATGSSWLLYPAVQRYATPREAGYKNGTTVNCTEFCIQLSRASCW